MSAEEARTQRMLYVGGLDAAVTDDILRAAFLPFGELVDVQIPMDFKEQKNRGFGFVEFAEAGDAKDALENMDNSELYGRVIRVNLAKPQMNKKKAVWEEAEAWLQTLKEAEELEEAGGTAAGGAPGDDADLRPAASS